MKSSAKTSTTIRIRAEDRKRIDTICEQTRLRITDVIDVLLDQYDQLTHDQRRRLISRDPAA